MEKIIWEAEARHEVPSLKHILDETVNPRGINSSISLLVKNIVVRLFIDPDVELTRVISSMKAFWWPALKRP